MKAMVTGAIQRSPSPGRTFPNPRLALGDVLIRVAANGLCATDLKIAGGLVPTVSLPHVPGPRGGPARWWRWARMCRGCSGATMLPSIPPRAVAFCDYCRKGFENYCVTAPRTGFEINGGFSEYMRVSGRNAVKISPESSLGRGGHHPRRHGQRLPCSDPPGPGPTG